MKPATIPNFSICSDPYKFQGVKYHLDHAVWYIEFAKLYSLNHLFSNVQIKWHKNYLGNACIVYRIDRTFL